MNPQNDHEAIEISADASFSPGGDRSRTGVVVRLFGTIVHWASVKQSLTTLSSCEAELVAAVTGIKLGMGVRQLLRELLDPLVTTVTEEDQSAIDTPVVLLQDNEACIRTLTTEVTSWRTRHYALRAAWIRDVIMQEGVVVKYQPGKDILADGLTKVLPKEKLKESRAKLLLQDVKGEESQAGFSLASDMQRTA